jgi:hypothetical protein
VQEFGEDSAPLPDFGKSAGWPLAGRELMLGAGSGITFHEM